ncbi:4Fe-4S binding protein [Slackia heliotrinireducens]|uniref:4Fe-4S binding protein n=1 Tax=Slackia heliotrinireducens TaxID=84110 RepID=UPI0033147C7C
MAIADDLALYAVGYFAHESHPFRMDSYCLNTIQRKTPCTTCSDVCPEQLNISARKPNWKGCINCNLCVTMCPTEAIHESTTSLTSTLSALDTDGDYIVVACDDYEGHADVRCACIGCMPWELLAAMSLSKGIVLKTKICRECPNEFLVEEVKDKVKKLRRFFGKEEFLRRFFTAEPEGGKASAGAAKRHAFSSAFGAVKSGAEQIVAENPPKVSHYRALLLESLESIPEENRPAVTWETLVQDGDCRGCIICGRMCPHDSIKLNIPDVTASEYSSVLRVGPGANDTEETQIEGFQYPQSYIHEASRCTQCGLCYISCPISNIGGWDKITTKKVPAYNETPISVKLCEKCKRPFKPDNEEDTVCQTCNRRKFGIGGRR